MAILASSPAGLAQCNSGRALNSSAREAGSRGVELELAEWRRARHDADCWRFSAGAEAEGYGHTGCGCREQYDVGMPRAGSPAWLPRPYAV
jgi:hypothetical protein